jgi:fructokinase
MNVAIHLKNFGNNVNLISKVGNDDLGIELLEFVKSCGVSNQYIQKSETHFTGVVKVNLDNKNSVTYKIVEPVAWDYIELTEDTLEIARKAECLIFGSLAARSPVTFNTLQELLKVSKYRAFDINLRKPFFEKGNIRLLLEQTDLLKLNEDELEIVSGWFDKKGSLQDKIEGISERFRIKTICVTLGERGAVLYHDDQFFFNDGFPVDVKDTIGSGDSFLASFISNFLRNVPIQEALTKACATGAMVAQQEGAIPKVNEQDVLYFINKRLKMSEL